MRNLILLGLFCLIFSVSQAQSYLGWITTEINLREGPGTEFSTIKTLDAGTQIFISSLRSENGFYNIIDIASNLEGYVSTRYIKIGDVINYDSGGVFQPTGKTSTYNPEIEIFNNTDRTLTLKMNEDSYSFYSGEKKKFTVVPGSYRYRASAPGVIPYLGSDQLESNMGYSWEFYISSY